MNGCSPACRRAVQRKIAANPTPLWISDDILSHTFQRFARVSNAAKRYGSHVPGPLEARRRLGKRRMAYTYESTPTPPASLGVLWNIFGFMEEKDRTRVHYEPPTPRSQLAEPAPDELQNWLSGWMTTVTPRIDPHQLEREGKKESTTETSFPNQTSEARDAVAAETSAGLNAEEAIIPGPAKLSEVDVARFRLYLKTTGVPIRKICRNFNARLYRSLSRGDTSNEVLLLVLSPGFLDDLRQASREPMEFNKRCYSLVSAIWNGISASKASTISDCDGVVIGRLLSILAEGPIAGWAGQQVAIQILRSLCEAQLFEVRAAGIIDQLLLAWVRTCCEDQPSLALPTERSIAETYDRVGRLLHTLSQKVASLLKEGSGLSACQRAKYIEALDQSRTRIVRLLDNLECWADLKSSSSFSTTGLSEALNLVSNDEAAFQTAVKSCTAHVMVRATDKTVDLRRHWMFVIASMPRANHHMFAEAWNALDISSLLIHSNDVTFPFKMIIQHWSCRGKLENSELVLNSLASMESNDRSESLSKTLRHFVSALSKWEGEESYRIGALVSLLGKIGHPQLVYHVVAQMHSDGTQISSYICANSLRILTDHNPRLAYKAYKFWQAAPMGSKRLPPWKLHHLPNLVLTLITKTTIPPEKIWDLLQIPLFSDVPRTQWPGYSRDPTHHLPPQMLDLISKVAIAFAHSKTRPKRLALRHILQCLHYLRIHNTPIPVDVTRAITHAGLTKQLIESKGFISIHRLKWAMEVIEWVEGKEIAETVDETVYHYRAARLKERQQARWVNRVLPVRQID